MADSPNGVIADYESRLPVPRDQLLLAMKLAIAGAILDATYTQEMRDMFEMGVFRIPYYYDDAIAGCINEAYRFRAWEHPELPEDERNAWHKASVAANDWGTAAMAEGIKVKSDFGKFIDTVREFDTHHPRFWPQVYVLAGAPYPEVKKRSFWDWFS